MSRSARTTKKQKEIIINILSENKILLGGKINPSQLPKVNKLWEELTKSVNEIGPPKTVRQWKESISEMKTNVRRRARDVRYSTAGTGGGKGVKPLSDFEERLLSLISNLTVEGDNLPEAGVNLDIENIPMYIMEEVQEEQNISVNNEVIAVAGTSNEIASNCGTRGVEDTSVPPRKKMKSVDPRKVALRNKEVVLEEHNKSLRQLARSNYKLAQSIHALAGSLNNVANKLPSYNDLF